MRGFVAWIRGFSNPWIHTTTEIHMIDTYYHLSSGIHISISTHISIYLGKPVLIYFWGTPYLSGHEGGVGDSGAQRHGRDGEGGRDDAAGAGVEEHWGG